MEFPNFIDGLYISIKNIEKKIKDEYIDENELKAKAMFKKIVRKEKKLEDITYACLRKIKDELKDVINPHQCKENEYYLEILDEAISTAREHKKSPDDIIVFNRLDAAIGELILPANFNYFRTNKFYYDENEFSFDEYLRESNLLRELHAFRQESEQWKKFDEERSLRIKEVNDFWKYTDFENIYISKSDYDFLCNIVKAEISTMSSLEDNVEKLEGEEFHLTKHLDKTAKLMDLIEMDAENHNIDLLGGCTLKREGKNIYKNILELDKTKTYCGASYPILELFEKGHKAKWTTKNIDINELTIFGGKTMPMLVAFPRDGKVEVRLGTEIGENFIFSESYPVKVLEEE